MMTTCPNSIFSPRQIGKPEYLLRMNFYPTAIYFEPDGYVLKRDELLGRQMAGNTFLETVLKDSRKTNQTLMGVTASEKSYNVFSKFAQAVDGSARTEWVEPFDLAKVSASGTLYMPDPNLEWAAGLRLRSGITQFSICGVTHTTATHGVLDYFKNLYTAPIMPWDALICTSQSVKTTVETVLEQQRDYLKWRFGEHQVPDICQLPIIPLGVPTEDFAFSEHKRQKARKNLSLAKESIVILYVGRLSPYTKMNPVAIYQGLERAAQTSQRKITLIECGWSTNEAIDKMMEHAQQSMAPSIDIVRIDGRMIDDRNKCLAAADIFISLSDNIQETFGLTPVEAMAAGLPVVISDWNGYSELISDGVEGFKIDTVMPSKTKTFAHQYEAGTVYARYCASVAQTTAVDYGQLVNRLTTLIQQPSLREEMAKNGRNRAKAVYDWNVVLYQYKELWAHLSDRRVHQLFPNKRTTQMTPENLPSREQPSTLFGSYPTRHLNSSTTLHLGILDDPIKTYRNLKKLEIVDIGKLPMPSESEVENFLQLLKADGKAKLGQIHMDLNITQEQCQRFAGILLKLGIIAISK